jgi:hypothetical protein
MSHLTSTIHVRVRSCVDGTRHASFGGFCRCREKSSSTRGGPASLPSPVRRWAAAALVGGVALASLSACATAQGYDSRNLSADLRRNACFGEGLAEADPEDSQFAECLQNANAAGARSFSSLQNPRIGKATFAARTGGVEVDLKGAAPAELPH